MRIVTYNIVAVTSLFLVMRTVAVTVEPSRNYRQAFSEESMSVMRPPPPPLWSPFQEDIRSIRSSFNHNFVPPLPLVDTTSRKPQQFTSESIQREQVVPFRGSYQTDLSRNRYNALEPVVQVSQSIEASEHHSTYHLPPSDEAIRVTSPPIFQNREPTAAPDNKKRATLKDVLDEDCPQAKQTGYCASPPRYPSNQVAQVMLRCSELLASLYAPVPEDEEGGNTENSNTNKTVERGNRQVWSWARPGQSQQTVCDSERQRIEPGYVLESSSGRWFVALQTRSFIQRVTTDTCHNAGKPCTATKCSRGNGFRNNTAKSSRCVQRYSYSHLVTWDPDKPDVCPKIRVFKFPTACVCYLTNS